MVNGLWKVEFRSNDTMIGCGVVVVNGERILGGDSGFSYIGHAEIHEGNADVRLEINRFNDAMPSVMPGLNKYVLLISGSIGQKTLNFAGHIEGHRESRLSIIGTKLADL